MENQLETASIFIYPGKVYRAHLVFFRNTLLHIHSAIIPTCESMNTISGGGGSEVPPHLRAQRLELERSASLTVFLYNNEIK